MEPTGRSRAPRSRLLHTFAAGTLILGGILLLAGCGKKDNPSAPKVTTVTGRVVYSDDANRGVPDVVVRAVGQTTTAVSDSTGWFTLAVDVSGSQFLQLTMSKPGFVDATATLTVEEGAAAHLGATVPLTRTGTDTGGGGTGTSGPAYTIVLKALSSSRIGVPHGGDSESATLTFEARDANGQPIDFAHRARIQFTLYQMALGGATLSPDTVSTDAYGLARVTLTAGTLAQAVQVRAQVAGAAIYSEPVRVAIHGGLPNAAHFSFAARVINLPGLVEYGLTDRVTAIVGDRYGNPVQEGTVVYFTTTGGVIQGSALTDDHGLASVDLVTAAPAPNASPAFSDSAGIARVVAQTMDENQQPLIISNRMVMFSGHTELIVAPTTFAVPLGGYQDFTITVRDQEHHNPLAPGSTITVTTTVGSFGADANITLPDTWDDAWTQFTVRLNAAASALIAPDGRQIPLRARPVRQATAVSAQPASTDGVQPATVTVVVKSPNGDAQESVYGTVATP